MVHLWEKKISRTSENSSSNIKLEMLFSSHAPSEFCLDMLCLIWATISLQLLIKNGFSVSVFGTLWSAERMSNEQYRGCEWIELNWLWVEARNMFVVQNKRRHATRSYPCSGCSIFAPTSCSWTTERGPHYPDRIVTEYIYILTNDLYWSAW